MPPENTPNEGQAPENGGPQDGQGQGEGQAPKTYDESYVKGIREEAAGFRTKLREAENRLKTIEQSGMSEAEKEKARADAAEARLAEYDNRERERTFASTVTEAARKAGALYPDRIHRIVDVERGEDGTPKNLDAALKALKAEMPNLFAANGGRGSADAGAGTRAANGGGGMNDIIRRAAGRT